MHPGQHEHQGKPCKSWFDLVNRHHCRSLLHATNVYQEIVFAAKDLSRTIQNFIADIEASHNYLGKWMQEWLHDLSWL